MSKVQAIESEMQKLTPLEIRGVRDRLENFAQPRFTDEFESDIQQSERDMAAGVSSRTRQPGAGNAGVEVRHFAIAPMNTTEANLAAR
ncbi:MAG: hypothetical protein HZA90_01380 [Verrucomicrobia bacterium]|nr:hypothetical protein [Verrucomicrobiota bacterium]